ncbi:lycopene cyclase family protein [Corynebacterium sp. P6129]|uniref:lycopene cyclase family protein n=1 Tax=Corynebacterium antarcticum TaxID=2800405 RepID=UPI0022610167|nr:lycopene cyclase family protein [Corynebacterium antarcticum]MCX7491044.1 lycopene cyclase family protein [Corynebacterium antarcticum]
MSSTTSGAAPPPVPEPHDMIVVGLGPAGTALAHRAQARGWRVLGVDPGENWPNTYGIFRDEVPGWLEPPPAQSTSEPVVIGPLGRHRPGRGYLVLDNDELRTRLSTFPVVRAYATEVRATSVTIGARRCHAPVVVDARGVHRRGQPPVQQAYGIVVATPLTRDTAVWMDLRQHGGCGPHPTFLYQVPVRDGILYEETILVADRAVPWQDLESSLRRRLGELAPPRSDIIREERVLIPMGVSRSVPDSRAGAVAFGARAGLISPISGYSLATSLQLVEPMLDALAPLLKGGRRGTLPWHRPGMRLDRMLKDLGQKVLLDLDADEFPLFMDALFSLSPETHRGFLTTGTPLATARGMMAVFRASDPPMRLRILRALLGG